MLVQVWAQEESCWHSSVSRHWPEGEGVKPGRQEQTGARGVGRQSWEGEQEDGEQERSHEGDSSLESEQSGSPLQALGGGRVSDQTDMGAGRPRGGLTCPGRDILLRDRGTGRTGHRRQPAGRCPWVSKHAMKSDHYVGQIQGQRI